MAGTAGTAGTAAEVAEMGAKMDAAIERATKAAVRYQNALLALPVRELLRLARMRGHKVPHETRSREGLLTLLR